jgi:hypothetical protein
MPVCGDLGTMSLVELLRWASQAQRTGVLEVEQNMICRRIEFRKGWIGACSTDDPPAQLGQILLSRGKIDELQLREALERQQQRGQQNLGVILVQMGVLYPREVARYVAEKAEETIQGLFDWEEAIFRYHEGATLEPDQIEVSLGVDEIIERGLRHQEELKVIRRHFKSSGVVLTPTGRTVPPKLLERAATRRIYEAVDGRRTIAEVLLHAHASAFLVIKLLYRLYEAGLVQITGEKPPSPDTFTLLDLPVSKKKIERRGWTKGDIRQILEGDLPSGTQVGPEAPRAKPDDEGVRHSELDDEVEVATRLMSRREYSAALELLNASYRANPGESYLRRLIFRAERAYMENLQRRNFSYDRMPAKIAATVESLNTEIGSEESFLLSLIDGETDIRSILWLSPMREVDVLRSLEQMIDKGIIRVDRRREQGDRDSAAVPPERATAR